MAKARNKRLIILNLLVLSSVCASVEISIRFGWLDKLEWTYYDAWHQLSGHRYAPEHVVIVTLDDPSMLAHQDEPLVFWGPHFARAIEVLRTSGARLIGLDFIFTASAESWLNKLGLAENDLSRTYDVAMRTQLAAGGTVLAGSVVLNEEGRRELLLPIKDYLFSLPGLIEDVGLTNLYSDHDGVVRRSVIRLANDDGEALGSTFAALLAIRYTGLELDRRDWVLGNGQVFDDIHSFQIGFAGPPGSVPRISFHRLLAGDADQDPEVRALTESKVAIIATEQSGMQDLHLTPYAQAFFGRQARMMSGAEVHANIIETLLTGRSPKAVPAFLRFIGFCAFLSAGMFCFVKLTPWQGLAAVCAGSLAWAAIGYTLFCFSLILPVANVQLGLAMSYLASISLRLSGEERERARLREIFGRYVSDSLVEEILSSGERPNLGGVMLQITVLFSDIRNFTSISEKLTPQEVVEMLNVYFSSVCEPIMEQGGMVDKFIGDAVMAVFGSPIAHADHPRRAIRAAIDMARRAGSFSGWMQDRFPDRGLPEFRIGIGIHTGEAVVGNIGSSRRLEFTAIGDTVNIASRLEGLTKELGWTVIASADTGLAAGDELVRGARKRVFIKGRKEAVEVVEVLDPGNQEGRYETTELQKDDDGGQASLCGAAGSRSDR